MQMNFGVWVADPSFSSWCHREEVAAWLFVLEGVGNDQCVEI